MAVATSVAAQPPLAKNIQRPSIAQPSDMHPAPARPSLRPTAISRQALAAQYRVFAGFDWEMADRFGLDANGNRLPDLPNTIQYVYNLPAGASVANATTPLFDVTFDASSSLVLPPRTPPPSTSISVRYRWTIQAADGSAPVDTISASPILKTHLAEGLYSVGMWVIAAKSVAPTGLPLNVIAQDSSLRVIRVEDIVIASIGDSFSSGEGNPERFRGQSTNRDAIWADDGSRGSNSLQAARNRRAHRSTLAWPAQAALAIEKADKHSSVTFISVATTGATIDQGLLAPSEGATLEPRPVGGLPAQLAELDSLIGTRQIDVLTISAGINDAGFAKILHAFLIANEGVGFARSAGATAAFASLPAWKQQSAVVTAALNGNWSSVLTEPCPTCIGIDNIRGAYRRLATELQSRFHNRLLNVFVAGYPDPTGHRLSSGLKWCPNILGDMITKSRGVTGQVAGAVAPDLEIGLREEDALVGSILAPLNAVLDSVINEQGWQIVSTQAEFADGHGYCAAWPNLTAGAYSFALGNPWPNSVPPSDNSTTWFRLAGQSAVMQGPLGSQVCDHTTGIFCVTKLAETTGSMHPNELGHQAVRNQLLRLVVLPVDIEGIGLHDADDQMTEAPLYISDIRAGVYPRSDVDVVRIEPDRLPRPAANRDPRLNNLGLSITIVPHSAFSPRIRLYDANGILLAEKVVTGNSGRIEQSIASAPSNSVFYVAVSAGDNDSYDLRTGTGDRGGMIGAYLLSVSKVMMPPTVPGIRP
jgi:lysophospholipase L1-like esterase